MKKQKHGSKSSQKTRIPSYLRSLKLERVTDTAGFEAGVIVDQAKSQVSFGLVIEKTEPTFGQLDEWLAYVAQMENVVAVSVQQTFSLTLPTRALVTFQHEMVKKDVKQYLSDLALVLPSLYAPVDLPMIDWMPLDDEALRLIAASFWAPDGESSFPPVAEISAGFKQINNNGIFSCSFEIDTNGEQGQRVFDQIQETLASASEPVPMTLVQVFRPTDPDYWEAHPDAGAGRKFALLVVQEETNDALEEIVAAFFASIDAFCRLRVHRLYGRHHLGLLLAAGLPVYGWAETNTKQIKVM